jgi:hypothetical protein
MEPRKLSNLTRYHPRLRLPLVRDQQVYLLPAIDRDVTANAPVARAAGGDESLCFFHPGSAAEKACDHCGRFLCAICATPWLGGLLCPECITSAVAKGKESFADPKQDEGADSLPTRRVLYDTLALQFALVPMLIFSFTIFTAPVALYIALRYWSRPRSLIPRTRTRAVFAVLIASAQLIGWLTLAVVGFSAMSDEELREFTREMNAEEADSRLIPLPGEDEEDF